MNVTEHIVFQKGQYARGSTKNISLTMRFCHMGQFTTWQWSVLSNFFIVDDSFV